MISFNKYIYPPIDGGPLGTESKFPGGSGIDGAVGGTNPLVSGGGLGDELMLGICKFVVCVTDLPQPSFSLASESFHSPSLKLVLGGGPPKCPCGPCGPCGP